MIRVISSIVLVLAVPTNLQSTPRSPCPNVFEYESTGAEPGKWYGVVNLSTDSILHSLWLNIVLDTKADILGNWVGDVSTSDNIDFKIENTKIKIQPGPATPVKFFVQYNPLNKPPRVQTIRLNGREICNANIPLPVVDRPDLEVKPSRPDTISTVTVSVQRPISRPTETLETRPVGSKPSSESVYPIYVPTQTGGGQSSANPYSIGGGPIPVQSVGTQTPVKTGSQSGLQAGSQTGSQSGLQTTSQSSTQTVSQANNQAGTQFDIQTNPQNGFQSSLPSNRPNTVYQVTPSPPRPGTSRPIYNADYDERTTESKDYFDGRPPIFVIPSSSNNGNRQQDSCGKVVRNNPNPLIVNGKSTLEGQWPWQIALYQTQVVDNKYICGGTLVSHSHVITAAHCVTLKNSHRVVNKNTLTIYLGKHNLRTSVEGVQIRFVSEIIVHPRYNASSYDKDLSILKLAESVQFTDWVRPVCLWPDELVNLNSVIGKSGSVVGWGFDATGVASEELSLVEMPVVDGETCLRSFNEFFVRFTSDTTYCAGFRDGTSVCNGDSGGGMVFEMQKTWYLRGLVSLSVARNTDRCDPSHYVVFTDLAKFLPWIKENISR